MLEVMRFPKHVRSMFCRAVVMMVIMVIVIMTVMTMMMTMMMMSWGVEGYDMTAILARRRWRVANSGDPEIEASLYYVQVQQMCP